MNSYSILCVTHVTMAYTQTCARDIYIYTTPSILHRQITHVS